MGKKFEASDYVIVGCTACTPSSESELRFKLDRTQVSVEYPPILITTLDQQEWQRIFGSKNGRIATSLLYNADGSLRPRINLGEVRLSKQAFSAVATYHNAIRKIRRLVELFSQWNEYEIFESDDGNTILVPRLSPEGAARISVISETLSKQTATRALAGVKQKRNSKPRTYTQDLVLEAAALYAQMHPRLREAAKDYTRHKGSHAWATHVGLEDKKRPGKPKLANSLIEQLPLKSPRELALQWTAEELNKRHANLGATSNSVRGLLMRQSKAEIKER